MIRNLPAYKREWIAFNVILAAAVGIVTATVKFLL